MPDSNAAFSITTYLVLLCSFFSLGVILLIAWLRAFVFPRIKDTPPLTLELPKFITKDNPVPISRRLEIGLALGAVIIYLLVRFIELDDFPIYFFADEAAQTVLAEELVDKDFRIGEETIPTYFYNVDRYTLSVSVYLQVIPYLAFGKSIWITRGVSVLMTLVGAISIGLILKQIFQIQYWWLGILVISITPAWFLHSRTAFETSIATALYGGVLYAYLLYLYRSPRYLYVAVFIASITFYSYNPARVVIFVTGGLFSVAHLRFHMRNWRIVGKNLFFMILLAFPYLRFQNYHIMDEWKQLTLLNSYWTRDLQFTQKILIFGQEYLRGFNIRYWYSPQIQDISRHVMKGYGHFLWLFFPFLIVGIWLSVKNWKEPAYQVLLITLVSAPAGGALIERLVTRSLIIVIPVTLLTTLGITRVLRLIGNQEWQLKSGILVFVMLGIGNGAMLMDVLSNAPLWFDNYGLYGLQYGGQQVFQTVNNYLLESPEIEANISPHWLNGPDMVKRFFVDEPHRIHWVDWMDWMTWGTSQYQDILCKNETISLATSREWEYIENTNPQRFHVLERIPFPNGKTGFILFELQDSDIQTIPAERWTSLRQKRIWVCKREAFWARKVQRE